MEEENKIQPVEEVKDETVEIINNLKQNTVSKDEYAKLLAKNNELMKTLANSRYQPEEEHEAKEATPEELDKSYLDNVKAIGSHQYHGNLEAAQRLLKLNDDRIRRGDGMVGLPTRGTPSADDVEGVEKTWELIRYAVDKADGSESVYNAIISDHLRDNNLIKVR